MIQTRQPRIEAALDVVSREREIVSTERQAFESFLARIDGLQATEPSIRPPDSAGDGCVLASAASKPTLQRDSMQAVRGTSPPSPDSDVQRIRTAYRETVMAVPHHDREYDDSLQENLAAEFGSGLARYVTQGAELTPEMHAALVEGSERAMDERSRFGTLLDDERESLQRLETEVDACESRTMRLVDRIANASQSESLGAIDTELDRIERRCDELVRRRQETIHDRSISNFSGIQTESLAGYLYGERDTLCPGLADVVDCLETVRHARRRCLR